MPKLYKNFDFNNIFDKARGSITSKLRSISDVEYRIGQKENMLKGSKDFAIPFLKDKRKTLTNAGLATGAIISENILDSIAKYATAAGLPIKTAIGLATKESTLGNPTDDKSIYKIVNSKTRQIFKNAGTGQWLNEKGYDVGARQLINFYVDESNPYYDARVYSLTKAGFDKPGDNFDKDAYIKYLTEGEKYADKKAKDYAERYSNKNVLEAGFRFYKEHPNKYNPGQPNYQQLVNKRANEVWNSPEIQNWYKTYRKRSLEEGGK